MSSFCSLIYQLQNYIRNNCRCKVCRALRRLLPPEYDALPSYESACAAWQDFRPPPSYRRAQRSHRRQLERANNSDFVTDTSTDTDDDTNAQI